MQSSPTVTVLPSQPPSSPRSVVVAATTNNNNSDNHDAVVENSIMPAIFNASPEPLLPLLHKKTIYFVRHAEALHNVKEKEAVQEAIKNNKCKETARKSILLHDETLKDAPLSDGGMKEVRKSSDNLLKLLSLSDRARAASFSSSDDGESDNQPITTAKPQKHYQAPRIVLVSPLRRALMTATSLFLPHTGDDDECEGGYHYYHDRQPPKFVALEILREKRTGMACDERSPVDILKKEFPHVDFTDVEIENNDNDNDDNDDDTMSLHKNQKNKKKKKSYQIPEKGEDNDKVRKRSKMFLEEILPYIKSDYLAVVSHKGWLRELRKTIKNCEGPDNSNNIIDLDFDIDEWHQTLYKNAEIRVAEFEWTNNTSNSKTSTTNSNSCNSRRRRRQLKSIVSRSVDNAIDEIITSS